MFILTAVYLFFCSCDFFCWLAFIYLSSNTNISSWHKTKPSYAACTAKHSCCVIPEASIYKPEASQADLIILDHPLNLKNNIVSDSGLNVLQRGKIKCSKGSLHLVSFPSNILNIIILVKSANTQCAANNYESKQNESLILSSSKSALSLWKWGGRTLSVKNSW